MVSWIVLLFCCVTVGNTYADDYFDRITVASNGRLTRFDRDRIAVYTDTIPVEIEGYQEALSSRSRSGRKQRKGKCNLI